MISLGKTSCLLRSANICHSLPGVRMAFSCAGALRISPDLTEAVSAGCDVSSLRFAVILHFSRSSASLVSTWSWCHLKQPWVSATLHPESMCWRLALMLPQRGQPTSWEAWESVVDCPHQEAESALWHPPDVCPADAPRHSSLPSGPGSLTSLEYSLGVEALLLYPGDFFHHHGLLLPLSGFGPELLRSTPA